MFELDSPVIADTRATLTQATRRFCTSSAAICKHSHRSFVHRRRLALYQGTSRYIW